MQGHTRTIIVGAGFLVGVLALSQEAGAHSNQDLVPDGSTPVSLPGGGGIPGGKIPIAPMRRPHFDPPLADPGDPIGDPDLILRTNYGVLPIGGFVTNSWTPGGDGDGDGGGDEAILLTPPRLGDIPVPFPDPMLIPQRLLDGRLGDVFLGGDMAVPSATDRPAGPTSPVPAPGAIGLLALAGLTARRRRRIR